MWARTDLLKLLGIEHPIIQAPMSSISTPELAAAVSNAGALGSLGCGILPGAAVREQLTATQRATNRPINVNFFAHPVPAHDDEAAQHMRDRLHGYYDEVGLGPVLQPGEPFPTFDQERLDIVLELGPKVVSFHFGLPDIKIVQQLKEAGSVLLCSATTVSEARQLEAAGVDAIIAQGYEAGGHRGTFTGDPAIGTVGTMALVPQIVDAVRVPVIAAGGIFDGRGIAASFALGASGVQIGTAFLACPEANVQPIYRAALRSATDESTSVTRCFTGRPARVVRNRFVLEMAGEEDAALAFPLQASLALPLSMAADESRRADFLPIWAGQGVAKLREMPAAALVEKLVAEAGSYRH
ncbi:MAG: nitronate monooxygenase [Mesorhizobium sp.]|uniref:NAD(P)H-dependent flavin oxidoreductase n=1 Tax=Mesorhizobium sp. TaxID=1871066 RepID=UPI000FE5CC66|nr:nitronate monooxygenase [Mesorhizobium sp.]RWM88512.1 MAG: nitronate monooxygenase [Mesorhizobium sp.]